MRSPIQNPMWALLLFALAAGAESQPPRREASSPRAADAPIYARIEKVRSAAAGIRIDGMADDWDGIPSFDDPRGDGGGDLGRDIVRVAIAPREEDLLVLIETAHRPSQEDLTFWFNADFVGRQPEDYQIGLSKTGVHTFWVFEEGRSRVQAQIRSLEVSIHDVVEVRVPYAVLASTLPASMASSLAAGSSRPVVRVFPFAYDMRTERYADYAPAVASFRLLATPFPLDPPLERNGGAVKSIGLPVLGKWYVGQGAFGLWTHNDVYGYDLYRVDATGHPSTVREGRRNEDYPSWNQPVFAPLSGRVIRSGRDAPDQPPRAGALGAPSEPTVNEAYLDIGEGLGLWLAHFRRGTVTVTAGQEVEPDMLLGNVGNSGSSSWPHLHLGLWRLPEGRVTLPLAFSSVRVGLNYAGEDPWARELLQWDIREGYFVERIRR